MTEQKERTEQTEPSEKTEKTATPDRKETVDRPLKIRLRSLQYDYRGSLAERIARLSSDGDGTAPEPLYDERQCGEAGPPYELVTEGRMRIRGNLCELSYLEETAAGLDGARSTLVFSKNRPNVLTLTRSGAMRMTLSFEEGRHHIGTYNFGVLQYMLSDKPNVMIASYARKVDNRLLDEGTLELDYVIEVRGLDTQRVRLSLSIGDLALVPKGFGEGAVE